MCSDCWRILPNILIRKLTDLDFPASTCKWIYSFLTDRPQTVRMGTQTSSTLTLSTGSPQGCVCAEPLPVFSLNAWLRPRPTLKCHRQICGWRESWVMAGLISNGDETASREEVQRLTAWCSANKLLLNTKQNQGDDVWLEQDKRCPRPTADRRGLRGEGLLLQDLTWHTPTWLLCSVMLSRGYIF